MWRGLDNQTDLLMYFRNTYCWQGKFKVDCNKIIPNPLHTEILTGHEAYTTPRPALIGNFPFTLFLQLNDYEIRKGKKIGVTVSYNNHRIFVGNIPKNRDRNELFEEFSKHARKLKSFPTLLNFVDYSSVLYLYL